MKRSLRNDGVWYMHTNLSIKKNSFHFTSTYLYTFTPYCPEKILTKKVKCSNFVYIFLLVKIELFIS
jgi:hypothetical protein